MSKCEVKSGDEADERNRRERAFFENKNIRYKSDVRDTMMMLDKEMVWKRCGRDELAG